MSLIGSRYTSLLLACDPGQVEPVKATGSHALDGPFPQAPAFSFDV